MTTSRGKVRSPARQPEKTPPTPAQAQAALMLANQTAFLSAYSLSLDITQACVAARIERSSHYRWLAEDPTYEPRLILARKTAIDRAEGEAYRRAVDGVKKLKVCNGAVMLDPRVKQPKDPRKQKFLEEVEYSDRLLERILSANDPRYRHKQEISGPNGGAIPIAGTLTDDLRARANAALSTPEAIQAAALLGAAMAKANKPLESKPKE